MAVALILSSHVAASRVGGSVQVAALERMGVEARLVPTVLFGRHPGLGAPGGGPVPDATFEGVLAGVAQAGLADVDVMICGYFASPGQVGAATRAVAAVRQASPAARILVDPIMGDQETGLYVSEPMAAAIAGNLVPLADILAPNAWELARLAGRTVVDLASAHAAAKALGPTVVVSSVPLGEEIGVLLAEPSGTLLARHARLGAAPRGTGDLLSAIFAGGLAQGLSSADALAAAVAETAAFAAGGPVEIVLERLDG